MRGPGVPGPYTGPRRGWARPAREIKRLETQNLAPAAARALVAYVRI